YLWKYTNGSTETSLDAKLARSVFDIRFIGAERTSDGVRKEIKREISEVISNSDKRIELDSLKTKVSQKLADILDTAITKMANLFKNENDEIGFKKGNISIASSINPELSVENSYITEVKDTKASYNL